MANEKNLKPVRTKKEARERGKNGGKKSGEVRRARKTLKEELLALLETEEYNKKISLAMIHEAEMGNVKAFLAVRDTIEENPKDKVEVSQDSPFEVNISVKKANK
jgi:hypothetical protein|nr:MAG TPA: hypothetical protein [Caudoviricetes sp.]